MPLNPNQPCAIRLCNVWMKATFIKELEQPHKLNGDDKIYFLVQYGDVQKVVEKKDIKYFIQCSQEQIDEFARYHSNFEVLLKTALKAFRLEYEVQKKDVGYAIDDFIYITPSCNQINSMTSIREVPCFEIMTENETIGFFDSNEKAIKAILLFLFEKIIDDYIDCELE